jgi:threonyl-tRNA synthetase
MYSDFGFTEVQVRLATRPEKYLGTPEIWEQSEKTLADSLRECGKHFEIAPGEGAFYGPKIEFHIKDSIGRFWQCGTLQLDRGLPEQFKLEYIDSESKPKQPVMLHRAVFGSIERFMGILIEHYNGHLPVWIAPVQAVLINVMDDQLDYVRKLEADLKSWGVRVEVDNRNEKLGYRIREAQLQKVPLMLVIGQKELESGTLSVRKSSGETINDLSLEAFREFLKPLLHPGGMNH